MRLEEIIKKEIREKGRITFKRFMELALYHEELGYYSKGPRIGKEGDFFTSPSVGSLFGRTLARAIKEMLEIAEGQNIVEVGAGEGLLAEDILNELDQVKYVIVEKSPALRKRQKEHLRRFEGKIAWVEDLSEIKIKGVIFSNELFDALPVHIVEKKDGKLYEVYVKLENNRFVETLDSPSTEEIERYFEEINVKLPDGFRTEVNLEAIKLLKEMAEALERGFIVTIDYGYPSHELYKEYRRKGTLLCYHRHKVSENPFELVGEKDITSHVNFSALSIYGKKFGLKTVGFTNQANFLIDSGILDLVRNEKEILQAKTLILPEGGMGETFKVLIQAKNVKEPVYLRCLKNAPRRRSYEL